MKKFLLHVVLPVLVIGGGLAAARHFKNQAKDANQRPPEKVAPAVEFLTAVRTEVDTRIIASGTTIPARKVTLTPEVSGRIVKVSKRLVPGNRVKKGAILAKIDDRDYSLAIDQEVSRVEQAELDLKLEAGRKEIAEKELKLLAKEGGGAVSELATRDPQMLVAKQNTKAAKSGLQKAELNLSRTLLRAPFNAMILEKSVDKGQLVGPSTPVATLIGTDELWVDVSIPVEELPRIGIPGINGDEGSRVTVTHRIGQETTVVREGRVLRLQGQLDPQNRTAQLLVSIDNPFDVEGLPLLAGAYVSVEIEGQAVTGGFELPRESLHDGAYVWVVDEKNALRKTPVEIGWRSREKIVVTAGLKGGEKVVTSPLVDPIDGMAVSPIDGKRSTTAKTGNQ